MPSRISLILLLHKHDLRPLSWILSFATTGLIPCKGKRQPSIDDPDWLEFVSRSHSRQPELRRSQVEATLILTRNKAIQSNLPSVAPSDEVVDQDFASGATLNDNIISNNPPKSPYQDALHRNPNEEHSSEFMFDEESASISAPPVRSFILFS